MTETKKLYHSISEVSQRLGVKPHVLRYWETQFRWLRPKKNRAGNRSYQEKDLILLEQIRELLYDRRFTIEGAKKELDRRRQDPSDGREAVPPVGTEAEPNVPRSRAAQSRSESHSASPSESRSASSSASPSVSPAESRSGSAPTGPSAATARDSGASQTRAAGAGASGQVPEPAPVAQNAHAHARSSAAESQRLQAVRTELLGLKEWLESRT